MSRCSIARYFKVTNSENFSCYFAKPKRENAVVKDLTEKSCNRNQEECCHTCDDLEREKDDHREPIEHVVDSGCRERPAEFVTIAHLGQRNNRVGNRRAYVGSHDNRDGYSHSENCIYMHKREDTRYNINATHDDVASFLSPFIGSNSVFFF